MELHKHREYFQLIKTRHNFFHWAQFHYTKRQTLECLNTDQWHTVHVNFDTISDLPAEWHHVCYQWRLLLPVNGSSLHPSQCLGQPGFLWDCKIRPGTWEVHTHIYVMCMHVDMYRCIYVGCACVHNLAFMFIYLYFVCTWLIHTNIHTYRQCKYICK